MAKGSIRFDDLINVEVAVDPTQAAGAKLLSAVNLVDGQSLGGGGGSSDFSTATLTVINNSENTAEFMCPVVLEDEAEFLFYPIENETTTYTIILYKNSALGQFVGVDGISGNIEADGDDYYIITGDCTVIIPAND